MVLQYSIWFFKKNVLNDGTEKLFREICILLGAAAMKYDLCDHFVEQQLGNPYIEKKNILHPCFEICFPFTENFEKCSCFVVLFLNFFADNIYRSYFKSFSLPRTFGFNRRLNVYNNKTKQFVISWHCLHATQKRHSEWI